LIKNGSVKGLAGGFLKNVGLKSSKAKAKKMEFKEKLGRERTASTASSPDSVTESEPADGVHV
jgi:hypothetical protein